MSQASHEEYLDLWSFTEVIVNLFFTTFTSFIGYVILLSLIGVYSSVPTLILTAFHAVILILRNAILIRIINRIKSYGYFKLLRTLKAIMNIIIILIFVYAVDSYLPNNIFFIAPNSDLILISVTFLYLSLYLLFIGSLSTTGVIKIEFNQLDKYFEDFDKRQLWMDKIMKRLERLLKTGSIKIDPEKAIYNLNMKILNSEITKENFNKIELWLVGEETDEIFMNAIKSFIPSNEITAVEKKPIQSYFSWITPEYLKLFLVLLVVLYVLFIKPELVEKNI